MTQPLNIAVVGSGIAGLSAAWLLSKDHRVALYEADARLGGHSNTVLAHTADGPVPVDTGFIVYNERNYPNLTALFRHLEVLTAPTRMTFSVSVNEGAYEYSGSGLPGLFGQPASALRYDHWRMIGCLIRFFNSAESRSSRYDRDISLGDFLAAEKYSSAFIEQHIVPMGAAIWSTPASEMLNFPARNFIRFYANHGMLQMRNRPAWRTVAGGSRNYVDRIIADSSIEVLTGARVRKVGRCAQCAHVEDSRGVVRLFDHVVVATHADQALSLLGDPDPLETNLLGAFRYARNRAVLHRDARWMPRRKRLWSSWNYLKKRSDSGGALCVTYWMNSLQNLGTDTNLFVTLNPSAEIHPKAVDAFFDYDHPAFSAEATRAQELLWTLQGRRRTWFCGSYFGYGFHEDGIQSGLAVAEQLGGARRPWNVRDESGRIHRGPGDNLLAPLEAAE